MVQSKEYIEYIARKKNSLEHSYRAFKGAEEESETEDMKAMYSSIASGIFDRIKDTEEMLEQYLKLHNI